MRAAWNYARGMAKKHTGSGGIFVRLRDHGDKVVGAFCGDPNAREVVWNGQGYDPYDEDVHAGQRPALRVTLNFYVPSERKMKIIEGGTEWFNSLLKVEEKYGLGEWLFEIERSGAAKDTKTKYSILPEARLSDEQKAEIEHLGLHDLDALGSGGGKSDSAPQAPAGGAPDGPIVPDTANALIERLKALPEPEALSLLAELKVQRVRDLRESQLDAALQILGRLEKIHRAETGVSNQPVDPFA